MALAAAFLLLTAACTSADEDSEDAEPTTTTDSATTPSTIFSLQRLVDTCRTEMLQAEPDVERLALDPSITNLTLGLLEDEVPEAAAGLADCLGEQDGARYLASDLIVTGQTLPVETATCLRPLMAEQGADLIEVSLRMARIEEVPTDIGSPFVETMIECVPGRFLAAPVRTENQAGYDFAVDEACLDQAHLDDAEPMRAFWELQTFSRGNPDTALWSDEKTAAVVAPLYACIDTGSFIAADPEIGASLSESTRSCIGQVATEAGYWESRVAQRAFDEAAYQSATDECLTPEEALIVLGIPLPVDDPETSNFAAVGNCYAGTDGEEEVDDGSTLTAQLASSDADDVAELSTELAACAGAEGVAGRYASTTFADRALPAGTYDCFVPLAEAGPATMLEGRLSVEAELVPSEAGGDAYIIAMSSCIAPSIYARSLFVELSNPWVIATLGSECVDDALADGTEAGQAYWTGTVFGGLTDSQGRPNDLAATAVRPLYDCIEPGQGVADLIEQNGVELSSATVACIDDRVRELELLERTLIGDDVDDEEFSGAIADCLSEDEVEQLRGR